MKPQVSLKNYQLPDKYGQWLGYKAISMDQEKGEVVLELQLRDDHLSPAGRVHGGVISGFFDFACGAAVFSSMATDELTSTVSLNVNYFSPLNSGDLLRCTSKVIFRGKKLCVVHALIYRNGEEKAVAMATGTFNIINNNSTKKA